MPSAHAFNLVLYQPVIPQNTGSIARLCACTGAALHLIHPLGFQTDEKSVKRAGLDYWDHVAIREHRDWDAFLAAENPGHLYLFENRAARSYTEATFATPAYLVLGSEVTGIPEDLCARYADSVYLLPMRTQVVRSLNLSQSAAIALYEALRQNAFPGLPTAETGPRLGV